MIRSRCFSLGRPLEYGQSKRFLDALYDWEAGRPSPGPVDYNMPRMRHLLEALGNPERCFRSVIVGGTNGKGTTASFLAHLLTTAGHRVGLYTSPHLHSIRERIQVNGQIAEKEHWVEGVTQLQHASFGFEDAGYGLFTKFEAITALAALEFKREGVEIGVFEVGLGGRYDATNAWDSACAILTSVQLDHTEVLGDTLEAIAYDKLHITRPGAPLFTPVDHPETVSDTVKAFCTDRDVPVVLVDPHRAGSGWVGRAQSLAVAAAEHMVGGFDTVVGEALTTFSWPGRFEVGAEDPLVILDGAHNPDAARALTTQLTERHPKWRVVLGMTTGHDAEGVIYALSALAEEVVLTASDHPRAVDPESLRELVDRGVSTRVLPPGREALKSELRSGQLPICVTGSLHTVADAREALGLVKEGEGISEDVLLESLKCLEAAVERLGLTMHPASEDGNVVRVDGPQGSLYFLRNKHPFNDYVSARLAEDKAYQYELFRNADLRVPYTMKLFNPYADERFNRYREHASVDQLIDEIETRMSYPLVVKRNQGSFAQGVYLEHDREGLSERLDLLFRHSGYLNNILICQSFVAGREYRGVATGGEVLLVYEKQGPLTAESGGDLNPLHRPGGKAVKVDDPELLKSFATVAECISEALPLGFYAIDAIAGVDGLSVLEVNPNPVCYFYNESNGRSTFVSIYERLLKPHLLGASRSRGMKLEMDED